ncbi:hypothetical protein KIN20_032585 [Parelaphostrongylus tenuis]|uniref:Uncharacterized protein n=1 Tax=Parelaphostrongylus tenuis TaxID=148309 RepID=A0AAD5WIL1_PARTN|nr:hypothetical protein KIN20_032585 [Parelaphostrongylus tenuis]
MGVHAEKCSIEYKSGHNRTAQHLDYSLVPALNVAKYPVSFVSQAALLDLPDLESRILGNFQNDD